MTNTFFTIDLSERFPRLAKAPIVEAVIHWQARAQVHFELGALESELKNEFQDYDSRKPLHTFGMTAQMSTDSDAGDFVKKTKHWEGIRLKSNDGRYVIQFTRNGLVFSRTNGYEDWESFSTAAKEAWNTYVRIAKPVEVERLGVRFINQISVATPENIAAFLCEPPTYATNLQLKEFVYQSTFALPGSPFQVRVIKVMQMPQLKESSGLFLDIDVFTNNAIPIDDAELDEALCQMRWLKNKVFFNLVTDEAVKLFGGEK